MNDFTKEDLQDLYSCCQGGMHDDHPLEDYKLALQIKLQSMIDTYCEHEYLHTFEIDGVFGTCKKCRNVHKLTEDEKHMLYAQSLRRTSDRLESIGVEATSPSSITIYCKDAEVCDE